MDIELDDSIMGLVSHRGRPRKPVRLTLGPEIQVSDLALLAMPIGLRVQPIKKISERHHGLARLVAAGTRIAEAAVIMGYHPVRASQLLQDPAFKDLVSLYNEQVTGEFASTMEQIAGLSKDVVVEIRDRLEDKPEDFSNNELRQLLETTLDRSGYGPSSKQEVNVTVGLAARLEDARRRELEARRAIIIDAEVVSEHQSEV